VDERKDKPARNSDLTFLRNGSGLRKRSIYVTGEEKPIVNFIDIRLIERIAELSR